MTVQISTAQDDLNEMVPIEYDFKTNKINRIFPFDEIFSIKLLNIEQGTELIEVNFIDYGSKKATPDPEKGIVLTADDMRKAGLVYKTVTVEIPGGAGESESREIMVPFRLNPNKKYAVEIIPSVRKELTIEEKSTLGAALKDNFDIRKLINTTAQTFLSANNTMVSYRHLSLTQEQFNYFAEIVVKKVNKTYRVRSIDPEEQADQLGEFMNSLNNLRQALDDVLESGILNKVADKKQVKAAVDNYKEKLKEIDWGNVKVTENKQLQEARDAVINNFDKKNALVATTKKTKIEDLFKEAIDKRDIWLNAIADKTISQQAYKISTLGATYRADFVKNAKLYLSLDLGAAYVWNVDRVFTYTGVNIYFRPVNKNVPLASYTSTKEIFASRTSFLLGITMGSVEEPNIRKGLIGNSALVLGAGFRIVPFAKVNAGCFVYYKYDNNPLISQERYNTAFSPFVSLSIDLDVKPLFAGIGEAIFKQ